MPANYIQYKPKTGGGLPWLPIGLLILFIICMVVVFRYVASETEKKQHFLSLLSSQALLSQQMAASASQTALLDGTKAFSYLQSIRDQFKTELKQLKTSDAEFADKYRTEIALIDKEWEAYREKLDMILFGQKILSDTQKHAGAIRKHIPDLQQASENIAQKLVNINVSSTQLIHASRQGMLIQRIDNNLNRVMFGDKSINTAADQFAADAKQFSKVINGMVLGNPDLQLKPVKDQKLQADIRKVANQFRDVSEKVSTILDVAPALNKLANASFSVESHARGLLRAIITLQNRVEMEGRNLSLWNLLGFAFGLLALLAAVLLGFSLFRQTRERLKQAKLEHDKQQAAIMQLLDEMSTLAEGDLTIKATVSESITGAIADSVNYAVEALRNLVAKINNSSGVLTEYASNADDTVKELSVASLQQDQEITKATGLIVEVTDSIHKVSQNASSSAEVARKSLDISRAGAQQVRQTISGMDAIREQIQITSKRIKRLSESSQEVGNIMHLMNDIAEQTNVLALNAAIQSSSARQFAPVQGQNFSSLADEVQQLAQDASDATAKVELLVKTMLTDTKEVVASMEMTTANVVEGARNAETAKQALNEIENVSVQLARLIANISVAAGKQEASTKQVHQVMQNIQEITFQTTEKVEETSQFIGKLNRNTAELRESIYGFVLPQDKQDLAENLSTVSLP